MFPTHVTSRAHLILLHLITSVLIIVGEKYWSWSSSLCSFFKHIVTYFLSYRPNVFHSTLFSTTLSIQGIHKRMGAVSKVNKKFISHLTRAQRTPSTAATVQVSHALPAVRFSCLLRGRATSFQDGVATGKGFLCAPFWGVQICDYSAAWVSCTV